MQWKFSQITELFINNKKEKLLTEGSFGLEREAQRVTDSGDLSLTPHPAVFGDKWANPRITTDFSESQIEMVTPVFNSVEEVYEALKEIQEEVEAGIGDEFLWPLSMPPRLPEEDLIPIARFPKTEECQVKEIYRKGLALRYGKRMQMISGIHFNFSYSENMIDFLYSHWNEGMDKRAFKDRLYFSVARNFLRYRWLLIYLFGASPSCDYTYYPVIYRLLEEREKGSFHRDLAIENLEQYATSLRVSKFGYTDNLQNNHRVYFNSIEEYQQELSRILAMESPEYLKLGLYRNGEQVQLNGKILQSESEFYSSVRLKQNVEKGETQLEALTKRGVKYLEVRVLDSDPFEKIGMSLEQLRFLQVFMLYCLFENSRPISKDEYEQMALNHQLTAIFGRKDNLMLQNYEGQMISLRDFAEDILKKCRYIAELMDQASEGSKYKESVEKQWQKLMDKSLLPSERIYKETKNRGDSFIKFGLRQAKKNLKEM